MKEALKKGVMHFLYQYLDNPMLSFIGKLFFGFPINDFHCGLRAFNRKRRQAIELNCTGIEFDSEIVVKSIINNFKIIEVTTTLSVDGRDRVSHLNTWNDGWRHLRFLLLYSPSWLFLFPGIFILY